ncbi:MAG TPA: hypothetical protein VK031_00105 [Tissierellaceae bacterium]|nr:hypothetical protein [Tissierellaceae bacterium]
MDKLLELCLRSIIRNINNDHMIAKIYRNKALEIHKEIEFEESCRYPIGHVIPESTKLKLYEMVS